ncbi:type VI secretion system tip protein VgrG, partial [Pseudomonas citronellolis]|nr:type VI secretion system tip protein VgrG [Pseudomonas citronellolis]
MLNEIRTFFDHSRHTLSVEGLDAPLDVLAFEGEERLSRPFHYRIEFTSPAQDIAADSLLCKDASFSLRAAPSATVIPGYTPPIVAPLRTLHGVITHFTRLSASR